MLKSLTVFFPVYNEQDNIVRTVECAVAVVPNFARDFEILAIDDGSCDNTPAILKDLAKKFSSFKVVTHKKNQGYGAALKSGFTHARSEYVFFTDSDGQFDMSELGKLIPMMADADIATGIRVNRQDHLHRRINAKAYNMLVKILFGLDVRDIDCAFKLIRRDVLNAIEIKSNGAFVSAEFLIRAKQKGFRIRQCPVTHLPRYKGVSTGNKPHVVLKAFAELFWLWKELRN